MFKCSNCQIDIQNFKYDGSNVCFMETDFEKCNSLIRLCESCDVSDHKNYFKVSSLYDEVICNECNQKEKLLIQTMRIKNIRSIDEMIIFVEFEDGNIIYANTTDIMKCPNYTEMFEQYILQIQNKINNLKIKYLGNI